MTPQPPAPVCKAFLVCRKIAEHPKTRETGILGLLQSLRHHNFPVAVPLGLFARCTSAHGEYKVEVQLQTTEGEVVWRDGPRHAWKLDDPLRLYDLKLNLCPIFPRPGVYDFLLLANGEEIARHPFRVQHVSQAVEEPS